jgi:hypothetical protein
MDIPSRIALSGAGSSFGGPERQTRAALEFDGAE